MSSIFDAIDEGDDPFGTEPTAYDLHVARAREERQLQAQVRKYGDNEMRVEPKVAVGSGGALSTEPFERSYQLRMPGSAARKTDSTDPLRSLMKAMERGSPSQYELADRICGHVSSHHEGGLTIMIAQQTHTGIPPNIRRLMSHWFLFPRRIAVDSIGHIAKSCMLEKATLRKCFDFCEGPYDFLLVENIPVEHRGRVRLNGWRGVKGLL